jgi:hypothetical protein
MISRCLAAAVMSLPTFSVLSPSAFFLTRLAVTGDQRGFCQRSMNADFPCGGPTTAKFTLPLSTMFMAKLFHAEVLLMPPVTPPAAMLILV